MKIIILHGDHLTEVYSRLTKFIETAKARGWEIVNDEIETTPSLFGINRLLIFRDFRRITKKDIKNIKQFPGTLVIYNEGIIPAAFLRSLPEDARVERFDLPKTIWKFLDGPDVKLLHQVVKHEPVEFIFAILAKRFRDLYWVISDPKTLPYQDWQIARLKKQAAGYTADKLKQIISELAKIDIEVKTSKADLLSALDFLLITRLE